MANLQAGRLNRRISVQTKSTTQDAFGSQLEQWTTAYTCWAGISPLQGRQLYSSGEFVSKADTKITIRWTSSFVFAPAQRVLYTDATGTHVYNIESISNPDQANKFIELSVYELDGQS